MKRANPSEVHARLTKRHEICYNILNLRGIRDRPDNLVADLWHKKYS
jgi:hypothetical protein